MWILFFLTHLRSTCDVVSIFIFTPKSIKYFMLSYQYSLTTSEPPCSNLWGSEERKIQYFPIVLQFWKSFFGVCLQISYMEHNLGHIASLKLLYDVKNTENPKLPSSHTFLGPKISNKWTLPFPWNNKVFGILGYLSNLKSITALKCTAKPHSSLEEELMSQNFTSTHSL